MQGDYDTWWGRNANLYVDMVAWYDDWSKLVTVGSLAMHISGVADNFLAGYLATLPDALACVGADPCPWSSVRWSPEFSNKRELLPSQSIDEGDKTLNTQHTNKIKFPFPLDANRRFSLI